MTRQRGFGSDTEFCAWMRACPELPSYGADFGLSASDNDITLHKYKTSMDGIGTREVQSIMQVEIKTRQATCNAKPSFAQMDTISKMNLFRGHRKAADGNQIRFYGVFVLVLSHTTPDNSDKMFWGYVPDEQLITDASLLKWSSINYRRLIELLRFEIHPVNFQRHAERRHHKKLETVQLIQSPLGFTYEKPITIRS